MAVGEDKRNNHEHSPFLLFSLSYFLLSMTSYGMEYPSHQLRPAVLAVSPLNLLPTPAYWLGGEGDRAEWEREKASMLCKHCPVIAKIFMCYQQL